MERQIVISGQHNKYQLKKMLGALLGENEYKEKKQQLDVLFYNPEFNDHIIEYLHQIDSVSDSVFDSIDMNKNKDKDKDKDKDKKEEEKKEIIKNVILTNQIKDEIIKNIHTKMSG